MTSEKNEILFIDANVQDAQLFVSVVSPDVKVVFLNDKSNVLEQIVTALNGKHNLDAIHVISHGSEGELAFANGSLNTPNLENFAPQLKLIGNALNQNGDILLYGCDVAKGDDGVEFINKLSALTNADVAASNDLTGSEKLGGDWVLENKTGDVESSTITNVAYDDTLYYSDSLLVKGLVTVGHTLVASVLSRVGTTYVNVPAEFIWRVDGEKVQQLSTKQSSYVVKAEDLGKAISVEVTGYFDWWLEPGDYLYDKNDPNPKPFSEFGTEYRSLGVVNLNNAPYTSTGSFNIFGTLREGELLTIANKLQDPDGLGLMSYQWLRNGISISGATQDSYKLTAADGGTLISVKASYIDLYNTPESVESNPTTTINGFPSGSVTISGTATENQILTANNTLSDVNGMGAISYQWMSDGVAISGKNQSTYLLTQVDSGKSISVKANYTDGLNYPESVTSSSVKVANVNDLPTGTVTISGTTTQGKTLIATNTLADSDGLGAIGYQWFRNDVAINNRTDSYLLTQDDVGKAITVSAKYQDNFGTSEVVTSTKTGNVANVNDLPTGSVTINSAPTLQGQDLSVSNTLADLDGLGTISYQWLSNGSPITGATQSTYKLTAAEALQKISVKATYVDQQNTTESVIGYLNTQFTGEQSAPTGEVTISGVASENQILTASNTLADLNGMGTISYQWFSDNLPITGATQNTYTVAPTDSAKYIWVRASYTDGLNKLESVTSLQQKAQNTNHFPTGSVTVKTDYGIMSGADQGQSLKVSDTLADIDGLGTITYQWIRNDEVVRTETKNTTTGANVYVLEQSDVGLSISVKASYTDKLGNLDSMTSDSVKISNINDKPTGSITISGTPSVGNKLSVVNTLADLDGMGSISYQWYEENKAIGNPLQAIAGATQTSYVLTKNDIGQNVSVKATYTDGFGKVESVISSSTTGVLAGSKNSLPTGTVTISGTAKQNQTLSASNTLADVDGLGTVSYQWLINDVAIDGKIQSNYTLTQSDVGKKLSVKASYTDNLGNAESLISNSVTISNVNDLPTGTVSISGMAAQGQILTVANTLADLDGLGTISYKWLSNGVEISGANQPTYTLITTDIGKKISVKASYVDLQGTTESVTSNQTSTVSVPSLVTISGNPVQGQSLSVTLSGINTTGAKYQWLADGTVITGKTQDTYTLSQSDVGKNISVSVSYSDNAGSQKNAISGAVSIANVNDAPTGSVSITGTPALGNTLSVSNSLSDIDGLGEFSYQWYVKNTLSNVTTPTYLLTQNEVGKTISVTVSYRDGFGQLESSSSVPSNVITNTNNSPTGTVVIVGKAKQGEMLSIDNTLVDLNGIGEFTYQWLRNGTAIKDSGQSSYYILTALDIGQKISVKVSYKHGFNSTSESVTSDSLLIGLPQNTPPTGDIVITGIAKQGEILSVKNTLSDVDGLGDVSYLWLKGGNTIVSEKATYTLTADDIGKEISVNAGYKDGLGNLENVTSNSVIVSKANNSLPMGTLTINGNPKAGEILTLENNISDADGITENGIQYKWFADDIWIGSLQYIGLTNNEIGKSIKVTADFVDKNGNRELVTSQKTSPVMGINSLPTGDVLISGEATVGKTLTVSNTLNDADGLGVVVYQWMHNGISINGATQSNYAITTNDVGKSISVSASYVDQAKNSEIVTSAATSLVQNAVTPVTARYSLSITTNQVNEGSVVTFNLATTNLTKGSVVNFNFGGSINNDDVVGGLPNSYFVTDSSGKASLNLLLKNDNLTEGVEQLTLTLLDDSNQKVSMMVNDTSLTKSIDNPSNPNTDTDPITQPDVNHAPIGSIAIQGSAIVGKNLTINNTLNDVDGLGDFSYQWFRGNDAIPNATGDTYSIVSTDLGKKISVEVSYIDGLDNPEYVSSPDTATVIKAVSTKGIVKKGDAKNNQLIGSDNNDSLTGGNGFDTVSGGLGADKFIFISTKDAPLSRSKIDTITDFNANEGDKIDLSKIDANNSVAKDQAFSALVLGNKFVGFTQAGQLYFDTSSQVLYGSVNADAAADFAIKLNGVDTLATTDFVL